MNRLTLALCVLGLLSGCGKSNPTTATADKSSKEGSSSSSSDPPPSVKAVLTPVKAVEDFLMGTYGPNVEIVGTPMETPTTYQQMPAMAVYVQWKLKGENEQKHKLYLVQEGRVRREGDYDTSKSLDANVAAFLKAMDKPEPAPKRKKK